MGGKGLRLSDDKYSKENRETNWVRERAERDKIWSCLPGCRNNGWNKKKKKKKEKENEKEKEKKKKKGKKKIPRCSEKNKKSSRLSKDGAGYVSHQTPCADEEKEDFGYHFKNKKLLKCVPDVYLLRLCFSML